jgi:Zn-dependent peptidase ImmA (M78 family)/predicted secreted protein
MADNLTMLRRQAQVRALQTRSILGISMADPVDVYSAIQKQRLWLLFEPLDGLFGMYQRQSAAAGVVLNVKVHPALQRYTAAHELGHHIMGHELGLDPQENITSWSHLGRQELEAQMFAAEFLMPLAAVNNAAAALGIQTGTADEMAVYQLSLRLRTSYTAMVNQLQTFRWFGRAEANQLRKIQPKTLKERLRGGPSDDARPDVWLVTNRKSQSSIAPLVGDEVIFDFEETPSTGYRWEPQFPASLTVEADHFVPPPKVNGQPRIGGAGRRQLQVAITEPKAATAVFLLRRKWEANNPADKIEVALQAGERPQAGVAPAQQLALLAS